MVLGPLSHAVQLRPSVLLNGLCSIVSRNMRKFSVEVLTQHAPEQPVSTAPRPQIDETPDEDAAAACDEYEFCPAEKTPVSMVWIMQNNRKIVYPHDIMPRPTGGRPGRMKQAKISRRIWADERKRVLIAGLPWPFDEPPNTKRLIPRKSKGHKRHKEISRRKRLVEKTVQEIIAKKKTSAGDKPVKKEGPTTDISPLLMKVKFWGLDLDGKGVSQSLSKRQVKALKKRQMSSEP